MSPCSHNAYSGNEMTDLLSMQRFMVILYYMLLLLQFLQLGHPTMSFPFQITELSLGKEGFFWVSHFCLISRGNMQIEKFDTRCTMFLSQLLCSTHLCKIQNFRSSSILLTRISMTINVDNGSKLKFKRHHVTLWHCFKTFMVWDRCQTLQISDGDIHLCVTQTI